MSSTQRSKLERPVLLMMLDAGAEATSQGKNQLRTKVVVTQTVIVLRAALRCSYLAQISTDLGGNRQETKISRVQTVSRHNGSAMTERNVHAGELVTGVGRALTSYHRVTPCAFERMRRDCLKCTSPCGHRHPSTDLGTSIDEKNRAAGTGRSK